MSDEKSRPGASASPGVSARCVAKPDAEPHRRTPVRHAWLVAATVLFASGCNLQASDQVPANGEVPATGANGIRLINPTLYVAHPPAGVPTPQREPNIDQAQLLQNKYPLGVVLEAGQNLFNTPFETLHGHGEGRNGPRSLQRKTWNPRGGTQDQDSWPFLRVNGIDSQSCFECHNTIGKDVPTGAQTVANVRRPGAQGGPAGAASSAFINDQFPEYPGQPNSLLTKFVRNPPHVFGTGYTQRLASEMTTELQARAMSARIAAGRTPGTPQSIPLTSKGSDYGSFSVTCTVADPSICENDLSNVVGVQGDLIVRPFQWGGIASTVRHFARDALDFHFSVQAVEKVGHKDCDLDGLIDEVTVGNVTALASYVTMFRPPMQQIDPAKATSVARGRMLLDDVGCTGCHVASLKIDRAVMSIQTPPPVQPDEACPEEVSSLIHPLPAEDHPAQAEATRQLQAAIAKAGRATLAAANHPEAIYAALRPHLHLATQRDASQVDYEIDLSLTGVAMGDVPAYVWPRLPADANNSVDVPLFSDLKLHYMGKQLSDDAAQGTDAVGYSAQPGYYVTRVLWGVRDTDPYLHDGRARTLRDAIVLHGGDGSQAKPAADKFAQLPTADQQALIDFLESLRLPIGDGVEQPEYIND